MKVSEIILIVHPLYRQTQMTASPTGDKQKRVVSQNEMHNYGKLILGAKKDSIVIFVPSSARTAETRNQQTRLIKFAQTNLGKERVLTLPTEFGFKLQSRAIITTRTDERLKFQEVFKKSQKKLNKLEFAPNVKITATGQFRGKCVDTAAVNISNIIESRGFATNIQLKKESKTILETLELLGKGRTFNKFTKWRRNTFGKRK